MKVEMIYLSQEDVIRCGGMSMDKAIDDLEEVFRLYDKGDYILPGKIVMKRPEPNAEETTGRINAMPGYIGGRFNMPGIKWDRQRSAESVQVRPAARRLDEVFGLPEGSEVYVLNDFKSSAYDAVRLFETLGLNQFRYIPFYPGARDEGVARPLITFGEYDDQCHYLPRCIEKENSYNES